MDYEDEEQWIVILDDGIGLFCDTCLYLNGECDQGINGSGKCLNCSSNYYGDYCNNSCSCINGRCDSSNGTCYCDENYSGLNCEKRYILILQHFF